MCFTERREADPRYDLAGDAYDESAPLFPPQCGHEACADEDRLHRSGRCSEDHPADCPHSVCLWAVSHATCDLERGHRGAHLFCDEPARMLVFPRVAVPA